MKLKIDLHVHTEKSSDACTKPEQLTHLVQKAGLDGVAITDHNILATDLPADIVIIPGIEISSRDGHIIALGVAETIPRGLSAEDTIRKIRDLGGISILAHPYDLLRSAIRPDKLSAMPDAVEVVNSASFLHNRTWKKARRFAEEHKLPMTAGSDSHIPETLGRAFTTIECESNQVSSVLNAIAKGSTTPEGRPYNLMDRLRKIRRARSRPR